MDGHSTYQTAVKRLSEATVAAVARAGLELDDVDLFVYHQANGRIIRAVGERLDLEPAKVADYVAHMANTSAASIPLTLSLLREDNRLRPGQKVLVAAIGAGLHLGRRHRRMGDRMSQPSRQRRRARHRRLEGHRRRDRARRWPPTAGPSRSTTAPTRTAPSAPSRRSRTPAAAPSRCRATSPTARPTSCSTQAEEELGAPVLALVNNAGVRADGLAIQLDDEDWDTVAAAPT